MPNGDVLPGKGPSRPVPGAGWALALLLGINLFNYIDRQILSATLPKIKRDAEIFGPDAGWVYFKLGLLTTAFMVSYMCLSPLFGRLGDVLSRWLVIGAAVIGWSLATGGTGLAVGYAMLFITRCLVGIGEAAYGPIAPAMLSDFYPVDHRGRIFSWFYMAIPVGSALGFVIGSQVAETSLGWRGAFLVAVVPGLVLGAICFFMNDRRPAETRKLSASGDAAAVPATSYLQVLRELVGIRSFVLCCAGMTASTFVLGGVATVMQLYLFEREARFVMDAATINTLRTDPAYQRSDKSLLVPAPVLDKLQTKASDRVMTADQFQEVLEGKPGAPGLLTSQEYQQYQSDLFDACTAPNSLTNGKIGLYLGAIVVVSGLIATLLGGLAGDYLGNRGLKGAYFHVAGWGMIAAFPFFLGMLYAPLPWVWLLLFGAVFFLFFNTGPANTVLANVTRSSIRATAFAINIFIIHALGDAISPPVIGAIADSSSMQFAFLLVSLLIPVSGILWIWGAWYLDEDTRQADAEMTADENEAGRLSGAP
jgi:MFS family permease